MQSVLYRRKVCDYFCPKLSYLYLKRSRSHGI
jgi:hypothetical protein